MSYPGRPPFQYSPKTHWNVIFKSTTLFEALPSNAKIYAFYFPPHALHGILISASEFSIIITALEEG
jgi:hypothetical protein